MLQSLKISDIKVGNRHRKDMGDLTSLADSIKEKGLLQPIGVTEKLELVFGERRRLARKYSSSPTPETNLCQHCTFPELMV